MNDGTVNEWVFLGTILFILVVQLLINYIWPIGA